jgi:hypothetical protein
MNVVEFIETEGGKINNLDIQRDSLLELRNSLLEGFNQNSTFKVNAVVDAKSDGFLRTDKTFRKLSKALHPSTKIGIIKNGSVYLNEDEVLGRSDVIANFKDFSGKEGWPVVLIPTPTGKTLVSFVSVPTLVTEHQDFILTAWTAFHNVRNAKDMSTVKSDLAIVKAVYDAYDAPFDENVVPDFNVLRSYVNDYITYTSGETYNPLLKEGTSQLNITEKGEITIWAVKDKNKETDLVIAATPREMVDKKKEAAFREKLPMLYYNVKTSTANSNGINSPAPMSFLSSIGGKLKVSTPVTYNQYMMSILETNIEPGRPVDPNKSNSELVHFANPVVTFKTISESTQKENTEEEDDPITKLFGPSESPFDAKPVPPAVIQAKADARENWITSTESIRKSPTTAGFEATMFLNNNSGGFFVITAPTEAELKNKIDDYYKQAVGIKTKSPIQPAPVSTDIKDSIKLSPTDKIIWGHPGLGKTTFREQNPNKVLDFDTDFKPKVAKLLGLPKDKQNSKGLNEWRNDSNETAFETAMRQVWKEAVAEAKKTGKMLVVSDMMFLRENAKDFDKIITLDKETFIKRTTERGDDVTKLESWKSSIDKTIAALDQNKVISTGKYFSEITSSTDVKPDIEKERQKITSSEFKEVVRLAKFYLENPNEPGVVGNARSKYPNLYEAVYNIEKRRQEELTSLPKKGENNTTVELMEIDKSPELFIGVLVTNKLNELKLFPKLEEQTGKSYRELIKTREGLNELKKFMITELDKITDIRAASINAKYNELVALEGTPSTQLRQRRDDLSSKGISIVEQDGTFDVLDTSEGVIAERVENLEKAISIGEKAASVSKPTASETEDLLDLDLDLGNMAEDIGGEISPDLKSIRTSLNTLKKNCN